MRNAIALFRAAPASEHIAGALGVLTAFAIIPAVALTLGALFS